MRPYGRVFSVLVAALLAVPAYVTASDPVGPIAPGCPSDAVCGEHALSGTFGAACGPILNPPFSPSATAFSGTVTLDGAPVEGTVLVAQNYAQTLRSSSNVCHYDDTDSSGAFSMNVQGAATAGGDLCYDVYFVTYDRLGRDLRESRRETLERGMCAAGTPVTRTYALRPIDPRIERLVTVRNSLSQPISGAYLTYGTFASSSAPGCTGPSASCVWVEFPAGRVPDAIPDAGGYEPAHSPGLDSRTNAAGQGRIFTIPGLTPAWLRVSHANFHDTYARADSPSTDLITTSGSGASIRPSGGNAVSGGSDATPQTITVTVVPKVVTTSITVTNAENDPIVGATVTAQGDCLSGGAASAPTSAAGVATFTCDLAPPGTAIQAAGTQVDPFAFTVSAAGFAPGAAVTLFLTPANPAAEPLEDATVVLAPTGANTDLVGTIAGTVTRDDTDEPLAGVVVRGTTATLPPVASVTDENGDYTLPCLKGSEYDLAFEHATRLVPGAGFYGVDSLADIDCSSTANDATLAPVLRSLTVYVEDGPGGDPVALREVTFTNPAGEGGECTTDADGECTVALPHGLYVATTTTSMGETAVTPCAFVSVAGPAAGVPPERCTITVASIPQVGVDAAAILQGFVRDANTRTNAVSRGAPGFTFSATDVDDPTISVPVVTAPSGGYNLTLLPGSYQLEAMGVSTGLYEPFAPIEITVTDGGIQQGPVFTVERREGTFDVTAVTSAGDPLANAKITVAPLLERQTWASCTFAQQAAGDCVVLDACITNAQGKCSIGPLPWGLYAVAGPSSPAVTFLAPTYDGIADTTPLVAVYAAGLPEADVGQISGEAATSTGVPLPGVVVTATPSDGSQPLTTLTTYNGFYTFPCLPGGPTYDITAEHVTEMAGAAVWTTTGTHNDVACPAQDRDFTFAAPPGSVATTLVVTGRVLDTSLPATFANRGAPGVSVTATPVSGSPVTVVTAADGTYVIPLVEGSYTFSTADRLLYDAGASATQTVSTGSGTTGIVRPGPTLQVSRLEGAVDVIALGTDGTLIAEAEITVTGAAVADAGTCMTEAAIVTALTLVGCSIDDLAWDAYAVSAVAPDEYTFLGATPATIVVPAGAKAAIVAVFQAECAGAAGAVRVCPATSGTTAFSFGTSTEEKKANGASREAPRGIWIVKPPRAESVIGPSSPGTDPQGLGTRAFAGSVPGEGDGTWFVTFIPATGGTTYSPVRFAIEAVIGVAEVDLAQTRLADVSGQRLYHGEVWAIHVENGEATTLWNLACALESPTTADACATGLAGTRLDAEAPDA